MVVEFNDMSTAEHRVNAHAHSHQHEVAHRISAADEPANVKGTEYRERFFALLLTEAGAYVYLRTTHACDANKMRWNVLFCILLRCRNRSGTVKKTLSAIRVCAESSRRRYASTCLLCSHIYRIDCPNEMTVYCVLKRIDSNFSIKWMPSTMMTAVCPCTIPMAATISSLVMPAISLDAERFVLCCVMCRWIQSHPSI